MYRNSKQDRAVRPVASLLITGSRFSQILDFFRGLKIGVPTGCLVFRGNLDFKNNND